MFTIDFNRSDFIHLSDFRYFVRAFLLAKIVNSLSSITNEHFNFSFEVFEIMDWPFLSDVIEVEQLCNISLKIFCQVN